MKIIILGSSASSQAIAHALSVFDHSITVISTDSLSLESLSRQLDIQTIFGVPSHPHILAQANAENADILIALTENDEMNMVACQIAYSLFNVPLKIAYIKSYDYFLDSKLFNDVNLPIDVFINPGQLIADAAYRFISSDVNDKVQTLPYTNFAVYIMRFAYMGVDYKSFEKKHKIHIVAIKRQGNILLNMHNLKSLISDEICILAEQKVLAHFLAQYDMIFDNKNIFIAGGDIVSSCLAKKLSNKYRVKLIEPNINTCNMLAAQLPGVTILNASFSDCAFLEQENIEDADIFCSLTADDEDNILNCMQAKFLKASCVIASVQKNNYIKMLKDKSLDVVLSPQNIVANFVLSYTWPHSYIDSLFLDWLGAELILIKGQYVSLKMINGRRYSCCGVLRNGAFFNMYGTVLPDDLLIFFIPDIKALKEFKQQIRLN